MKSILSRTHRRVLAPLFLLLMTIGFTPQAFSAGLIASVDLNGDGIAEHIYNTGSTITVKNSQGVATAIYYIAGTWGMMGIADLDGYPGAEIAVRTYRQMIVITHRTKNIYPYQLSDYGGNWAGVSIDQFDGVVGNEVAINNGDFSNGYSSYLFVSHRTRTVKQHYFSTAPTWATLSINDFNGVAGKEVAINTGSMGYVAILHPRTLVESYYSVGRISQFLGASNLDGVAGLEIMVKGYAGLVYTINDRTGAVDY
ncbi:MAG: hypothetical protein ABL934_06720 [Lysobacteraceae bacterium]